MSNFTGVTFSKQRITPSDDAIIRRAMLPDGKLTGCEISYSGSTLTMSPGHLIACGRQFRHPATQNWAVTDATSGFARLVLTIDLTKEATKETFKQIDTAIEYASARDGFVDLDQSDINASGIRYQIVLCVVSLGTGGITGIVEQLEQSEVGGVNFKVVGGLTQPVNPKENTVWVKTDVSIPAWIVGSSAPTSPIKDMVWISSGGSGQVAINLLKKNAVYIYPNAAQQYVSGAWVTREAAVYQNKTWVDLILWIYNGGKFSPSISVTEKKTPTTASITYGDEYITLSTAAGKTSEVYVVAGPVDLTAISKLVLKGTFVKNSTSSFTNVATIFVADAPDASYKNATAIASLVTKDTLDPGYPYTVELDVSGITGEHYVLAGVNTQGSAWSTYRANTITMIRGDASAGDVAAKAAAYDILMGGVT